MMNGDNSLMAMEEVSIARDVHAGTLARREADSMDEATRALRHRRLVIQDKDRQLSETQRALARSRLDHGFAAVVGNTAKATLDQVIRDFAKAAGVPESELRNRYNVIRTQHLNRQINEAIAQGGFDRDPRADMPDGVKQWYVPGLDADHGF